MNFIGMLILNIVFYISKVFTAKNSSNWFVYNFGKMLMVTHSIDDMEGMIKEFSKSTGCKFDYSYTGGRAVIKYIGFASILNKNLEQVRIIHEKYQKQTYNEINKTRTCKALDGSIQPIYSESNIQRTIDGIWEYNRMYR